MNKPFLRIDTDTKKITTLQKKLAKYGSYAISQGMKATVEYLNDDEFRESMYPPDQSGQPFTWSSEKQRRAFFASDGFGRGIPTQRTYELMLMGRFRMSPNTLWIEYENFSPYSKYVIGPGTQIIGHIKRGWKPVHTFVVSKSKDIAKVFQSATKRVWKEMDKLIFGQGAGL